MTKDEFKALVLHYDKQLGKFRIWRVIRGGMWIKFTNDEWSRCKWIKRVVDGYIKNPHGGEFHKSFKEIVRIEEYWHGDKYDTESKEKYDEDNRG